MISLGLTRTQRNALHDLLASSHSVTIRVRLLDLNHGYLDDLSLRFIDGQVTIDDTADVTRALSLDLIDPTHSLHLDSDSPSDGALFMDRMISIVYVVSAPTGGASYDIPIFCGPITKVNRNGVLVSIEAQGKEILAMTSVWKPHTYKKGTRKTSALRNILSDLAGESRMDINTLATRLPRHLSMGLDAIPWVVAKKLAAGMNRQLFYDGRGIARLRVKPGKTVFVYRAGPGGTLLTDPEAGFTLDSVVNAVEVIGGKPKHSTHNIRYRLVAQRSHPLSPWKLGRTNSPRYMPVVITDDNIRTKSAAKTLAKKTLKRGLIETVEVSFDALPIPHLEPGDLCRVHTPDFAGAFRVRALTIPLSVTNASTVGYLRNVAPNRRAIRLKRHH